MRTRADVSSARVCESRQISRPAADCFMQKMRRSDRRGHMRAWRKENKAKEVEDSTKPHKQFLSCGYAFVTADAWMGPLLCFICTHRSSDVKHLMGERLCIGFVWQLEGGEVYTLCVPVRFTFLKGPEL